MYAIIIYLVLINVAAFTLMRIDKTYALHRKRRISERRLLTYAAVGGSLGAWLAMHRYRHKTKHPKFSVGLPVLLILHIAGLILLFRWTMEK
ncbi:DUF1294 domain-containing protein [Paenibacillus spongiae]|uniref:DUF1294 domain-containing protein n=1 Tax=Paenibacillus spongiae TaxID=2909671 RepID=A0ABY5SK37_9BACL|nr:DUF1294 domain-containing protein [Paenibacillus spongiae]UVI32608.1 DUF1294 domain-containing protein [Paenibacillus spongiae]